MIAYLTGKIVSKTPTEIVLDVSGVGYLVYTTLNTFENIPGVGNEASLFIHTHVREDNLSLYGFLSDNEKYIFIKLLKISGIGPKLAMSILSGVPANDFVNAVTNDDIARLNAIPGVGKKTAERIILDLKDKLLKDGLTSTLTNCQSKQGILFNDALSALTNLGYKQNHVEMALRKIDIKNDSPLPNVIKNALKELATL